MKYIPYIDGKLQLNGKAEPVIARELYRTVAMRADQGTRGIDDLRSRIRILDALDKCENGGLVLEDADWSLFKQLVETFPYAIVTRALMDIVEAVQNAKAPD